MYENKEQKNFGKKTDEISCLFNKNNSTSS